MTSFTPMFPGWHRKLHGRRPVRNDPAMRRKAAEIGSLCIRQAKDLFGDLLAIELLAKVPGFRNRTFPLPVVFWTFLCQVLASGSCRHGVSSVQSHLSRHGKPICSPSTAAYCKARVRIPIRLLLQIHRRLAAGICPRRSPRTFVIDGTTLGMPDTPANQSAWPQSRSQKDGCGFPIMRLVGLFDLRRERREASRERSNEGPNPTSYSTCPVTRWSRSTTDPGTGRQLGKSSQTPLKLAPFGTDPK